MADDEGEVSTEDEEDQEEDAIAQPQLADYPDEKEFERRLGDVRLLAQYDRTAFFEQADKVLNDIRSFFMKYKDKKPAQWAIPRLDWSINHLMDDPQDAFRKGSDTAMEAFGQLKFRADMKKKKEDWLTKAKKKIQIEIKEKDLKNIEKLKRRIDQICGLISLVLKRGEGLLIIISGATFQGKSMLALYVGNKLAKNRGKTFSVKPVREGGNTFYYDGDISDWLWSHENDVAVVDEGYEFGFNEETMQRTKIKLGKDVTKARKQGNALIMCFSVFDRSTIPLREAAKMRFHKPAQLRGIYYIKQKLWVSSKSWNIKELNDAQWDDQISFLLRHSNDYIARFESYTVSARMWNEYMKWSKLETERMNRISKEKSRQEASDIEMLLKIEEGITSDKTLEPKAKEDELYVTDWIMTRFPRFPKSVAKGYAKQYLAKKAKQMYVEEINK